MTNLKKMTNTELKQYLSAHRTDNDKFSEALGELLERNQDIEWYPANMTPEKIEKVLKERINLSN